MKIYSAVGFALIAGTVAAPLGPGLAPVNAGHGLLPGNAIIGANPGGPMIQEDATDASKVSKRYNYGPPGTQNKIDINGKWLTLAQALCACLHSLERQIPELRHQRPLYLYLMF